MESIILLVIAVLFGYYLFGKKNNRYKSGMRRFVKKQPENYNRSSESHKPPRWKEKDELFWGMINQGVNIKKKACLLSKEEKKYLERLHNWFGGSCYISCQVDLAQVIDMPEQDGFSDEERRRFFSIYNRMSLDFVLFSIKTGRIVCVIELNDQSHEQEKRKERDRKLVRLMEISAVPFIEITPGQEEKKPDVWGVRKEVEDKEKLRKNRDGAASPSGLPSKE